MDEVKQSLTNEKEEEQPLINFGFPEDKTLHLIKVIGVGGAGGNAVSNMYEHGVCNVEFAVCNTDSQALINNKVPIKIQFGEGLGAGGKAENGRKAAESSIEKIESMLSSDAKMVFITAGMGGGTGTGAAPVVARIAKQKGLLTVGVVTLPFLFEKRKHIDQALKGVEQLKKNVDALLIVNNQRLLDVYSQDSMPVEDAFSKADDILFVATKSIAEIITVQGIINMDFEDVRTVLQDSGAALMATGYGEGENRILKAINNALHSPLLNNVDIRNAKRLLYVIYTCKDNPVTTAEFRANTDFMEDLSEDIEVLFGLYRDDSLENRVKVTIIATGYDRSPSSKDDDDDFDINDKAHMKELRNFYYKPFEAIEIVPDSKDDEMESEDDIPFEVVEGGSEDVTSSEDTSKKETEQPSENLRANESGDSIQLKPFETEAPVKSEERAERGESSVINKLDPAPKEPKKPKKSKRKNWLDTFLEKLYNEDKDDE